MKGSRFLFYSNELVGLGHLRRTLAITEALRKTSLVVTGNSIAPFFDLPKGVDVVKLPSTTRDREGKQRPQRLAVEIDELTDVRSSIALATAIAFRPDVAVVDKHPLGLGGELEPTLGQLKLAGCKLVLGLRDIDDSPEGVRRRWRGDRRSIERYYDAVLVYGPEDAPDALHCLGWRDLEVPVHHVGYIAGANAREGPDDMAPGYVLAAVGGGSDGFPLLAGVLDALRLRPLPTTVCMVTGPLMPEADVERLLKLAEGLDVRVWRFRRDMPRLIAGAAAVVTMAGYNTLAEVVRARKPVLMVPRVRPSEEQLVRACRLAASGAGDMLHPDVLTPESMSEALDRLLVRPAPPFRPDQHRGSQRAAEIIDGLAGGGAGRLAAVAPVPPLGAARAP